MIQAHKDKVYIIPFTEPEKSSGGLFIPEVAKNRSTLGVVKYIGPDVREVKIGDVVMFGGYSGTTVAIDGEGFLIIMSEEFIISKLGEDGLFFFDLIIPGLYFKDEHGDYFQANHEIAATFMRDAIQKRLQDIVKVDVESTARGHREEIRGTM